MRSSLQILGDLEHRLTDPFCLQQIERLRRLLIKGNGFAVWHQIVSEPVTRMQPDWTAAEDTVLRIMWDAGTTASEISALILGRTRNAIIGRAHRLNLPSRPSPLNARP